MGKKVLFFVSLILCYAVIWAAGGREANVLREAEDPAGFTDTIDTSEKKPGKWNYFLEAKDKAGNSALAGPENIRLDPASDLPQVTIINPMPNMRVQGNLNIVGIAVDDDAVQSVWLTIKRGRDGKGEELVNVQAVGDDYWSYFLNTTDDEIWTDGVYTITAWAVDVNGLSGISEVFPPKVHRKHEVYWHLDRKNPDTIIESHEAGALVSGNVRLRGFVADGNGVTNLSYSIDEGATYTPVKISQDRRTGNFNWDININTSKVFEDGPAVIWLQAIDGQGSVGTAAHLLFVNNTPPEVQIVYPQTDETVNGIFSIAGSVKHPIGLKSISWSAGKGTGGEFELLPGNDWWSAEVDTRGLKANSIDIEIRAEDVSGNVTIAKQKYKVDQNADLPVISLLEPASVTVNEGTIVVKGTASDDDGVSSIFYSINSGEETEIPCHGYFQFLINEIPEGVNTFEIWAKDITGVAGNKVQVKNITVPPPLPEPGIASVTTGSGNDAVVSQFYTGMTVRLEQKIRTVMEVTIKAQAVAEASVTFGKLPSAAIRPSTGKDGLLSASVQVPENLPSGFTKIEIRAADRFGREVVFPEYVYIENSAVPSSAAYNEDEYDSELDFMPFLGFSAFNWVRPKITEDGRILISSEDEVLLGLGNEQLSSAVLNGAGSNNIVIEVDEYGRLNMTALREGSFGPFTLRLETINSTVYDSEPFSVLSSFSAPSITLQNAPEGSWLTTQVPVSFNVAAAGRVTAIDYSLDMGQNWNSFLTSAEAANARAPFSTNISRTLDITDAEDGYITVLIKAVNEAGVSVTESFSVLKDTQAPAASLVMPITEARVNGTIRIGFLINEKGALKSVSYNRPAGGGLAAINALVFNAENMAESEAAESGYEVEAVPEEEKKTDPLFLEVLMDSIQMPLAENMRFIFEDKAGNTSEINAWEFIIDQEMDIPVAHIILPFENEVITTDFIASGIMFDDDDIKQISWSIDNNPPQIIEAENAFSIPIELSSLTDNEHIITITAEDIYGVVSAPVTRTIRVSLAEPAGELTYPLFDTVLREAIQVMGTASDANGIKEVQVSIDNGNTFATARGTPNGSAGYDWTFDFNTKILKDGPHVVFFRVLDNYDIPATYASMINVDNTPPEIFIDNPGDGSISVGNILVMGRSLDPNLENVRIEMRSLEGAPISAEIRARALENNEVIKEEYNFEGQRDGLYNIEVVGTDKAGNVTRVSRNFQLARETFRNTVNILYPLDNENVGGVFNLYGWAGGTDKAGTVTIKINGIDAAVSEVDDSGFYRFTLNSEFLTPGTNTVLVHSDFGGGRLIESRPQNINFMPYGPWVTIDSFNFGDFAFERPYLYGRVGFNLSEEDQALLADRNTDRAVRAAILDKKPDFTEISFDNGKTFEKTSKSLTKGIDYRFRLETGEMPEGMHYIYVRSTMQNGETAVTRMLVQVDKTPPVIRLISPESGGIYNMEIPYSASATDDIELVSLNYNLRAGDKSAYEVPGFLQGLYFEAVIPPVLKIAANDLPVMPFGGGATFMDMGVGLSFFDDNVKIQANYGFLTQELYEKMGGEGPVRYGGNVLGIKLLASLYTLPFGALVGPDFEWLSASFAVGANFSLFDIAREGYTQSGVPTWMSALLLQIEFPKVTIPKRSNFRTFSLFTEGELWFVPTDVNAEELGIETILPKIIMGLRLYIF